jgi:hypothetical protein
MLIKPMHVIFIAMHVIFIYTFRDSSGTDFLYSDMFLQK